MDLNSVALRATPDGPNQRWILCRGSDVSSRMQRQNSTSRAANHRARYRFMIASKIRGRGFVPGPLRWSWRNAQTRKQSGGDYWSSERDGTSDRDPILPGGGFGSG